VDNSATKLLLIRYVKHLFLSNCFETLLHWPTESGIRYQFTLFTVLCVTLISGAKYCEQRVCMYVCLFVSPLAYRIQVMSPGPSSHQQQGTCLPTEPPDNLRVCVWSGIKPLSHAATMTLSSSQPDSNLVNAPSLSLDPASGISCPPTSKPSQTILFLGANLNFFYFRGQTISVHSHCSGPPVNCRWQHRLCVVVLYCIISQNPHVQIALYMLPVAVRRSTSDGNAICYVLPVLLMTSYFHITEQMDKIRDGVYIYFAEFARRRHQGRSLPSPTASCCFAIALYSPFDVLGADVWHTTQYLLVTGHNMFPASLCKTSCVLLTYSVSWYIWQIVHVSIITKESDSGIRSNGW